MENQTDHKTETDSETNPENTTKMYTFSQSTLMFFVAILICTIAAGSLLILHFGVCSTEISVQTQVCQKENVIPILTQIEQNDSYVPEPSTENPIINESNQNYRLPKIVYPMYYNLKLLPFILNNNSFFNGHVIIRVIVTERCQNITLNARGLSIQNDDVKLRKIVNMNNETIDSQLDINKHYYITTHDFYVIESKDMLENGIYEVDIKFVGNMSDHLFGMFKSNYHYNNTTRSIVATKFEPIGARKTFPCFDEPGLKAQFKITLGRPINMTALSNMPLSNVTGIPIDEYPDYVWDEFDKTKPMSTYLLAFFIVDFDYISNGSVRIWNRNFDPPHNTTNLAEIALKLSTHFLSVFGEYFDYPYMLPKLDIVASPDYDYGAMENWGLMGFQESALLYENQMNPLQLFFIKLVITHELSHQWFGDLVTPNWWNDLWIKEGFANFFMMFILTDPSDFDELFIGFDLHHLLTDDAMINTHPIRADIQHPDEIRDHFDSISYKKGSSLIRMAYHFLTPGIFRNSVIIFLKESEYKSYEERHLWEAFTAQARLHRYFDNFTSVEDIMTSWSRQPGYPEVIVTRNYENQQIEFTQQIFTYIGNQSSSLRNTETPDEHIKWWIPISYTTQTMHKFNETKPSEWIRNTKNLQISVENLAPNEWIIVNILQAGIYRVNYDEKNWILLTTFLQNLSNIEIIHPINRAQIVDDALNLARAGRLKYDIALNTTKYLVNETSSTVWSSAMSAFSYLDGMLSKDEYFDKFRDYMLHLLNDIFEKLTELNPHKYERIEFYSVIFKKACHFGNDQCIEMSQKWFNSWMHDANNFQNIPKYLREQVYCTAIKHGNEKEWNFLWNKYLEMEISGEKEAILEALACSQEPWLLNRFIHRTFTNDVRQQNIDKILDRISENPVGQQIVFEFLKSNFTDIKKDVDITTLLRIIKVNQSRLSKNENLLDLKRFIKTHFHQPRFRKIKQVRLIQENIEANIIWKENSYNDVIQWLQNISRETIQNS